MIFDKKFYSIIFFLFLIFSFSSCEKNEDKDLFSLEENEILEGDFLNGDKDVEEKSGEMFQEGDDLFDGAEETKEELGLGASILNGISSGGNYFNQTNNIDLYQVTGYIDFGDESFEKDGKVYSLNSYNGDILEGLKIAFADNSGAGVFDSISYSADSMEDVLVLDGKVQFNIFFDGDDSGDRAVFLKRVFSSDDSFLTQVKIAQKKKDGSKYIPVKIHSKVVSQLMENEDGGRLFNWPCLASDFTSNPEDFKNQDEFFSELFYEKTSTGYILNDSGDWDNSNFIVLSNPSLCALNDTYNYIKTGVVGSQCWEGENKNHVGKVVFRPKEGSFCTQAESIEDEDYYPEYACNIEIEKVGGESDFQEYFGGEKVFMSGKQYTCGEE